MHYRWLLTGLFIILVASVVLNLYLFMQGRRYYAELNETRLDPLGLNNFADELPANTAQPMILFYGDSRAMSWPIPDILDQATFVNRGIGAQTSAQTWLRFDDHVAPLQPQIMILQVGINDLKTIPLFPDHRQSIIQNCQDNIRRIVTEANELGTTVFLTTIFPIGDIPLQRRPFWSDDVQIAVSTVNDYIASLASEQVIVFDAYSILADRDGLMRDEYRTDELHINTAGYAALNQALVPVLETIIKDLV